MVDWWLLVDAVDGGPPEVGSPLSRVLFGKEKKKEISYQESKFSKGSKYVTIYSLITNVWVFS